MNRYLSSKNRKNCNKNCTVSCSVHQRDEYEAQQQKALASLSKSHNQLALATSIEEGMKAQFQMRKQIAKANAAANKSNHDGTESNAESANNNVNNATAAGVSGSQNTSTVADDPVAAAAAAAAIARVGGAGPSVPNNSGPPPPPPGSSVAAGASKVNKAESVGENSSNTSGTRCFGELCRHTNSFVRKKNDEKGILISGI